MRNAIVVILLFGGFILLAWWVLAGGPGFRSAAEFVRGLVARDRLTPIAITLAVAVTIGAVAAGIFRASGVDTSFKAYATRYGLVYSPRSAEHPMGHVTGHVDGRAVELRLRARWDLQQSERETWTELSVELVGAPREMSLTSRIALPIDPEPGAAMEPLDAADGAFAAAVEVRGRDHHAIRAWLDPRRQEVVTELLAEAGYLVAGGRVAWTARHAPASVASLGAIHDRLVGFARRLDAL